LQLLTFTCPLTLSWRQATIVAMRSWNSAMVRIRIISAAKELTSMVCHCCVRMFVWLCYLGQPIFRNVTASANSAIATEMAQRLLLLATINCDKQASLELNSWPTFVTNRSAHSLQWVNQPQSHYMQSSVMWTVLKTIGWLRWSRPWIKIVTTLVCHELYYEQLSPDRAVTTS